MRIFRFEHQRAFCDSVSRLDHGPISGDCLSRAVVPHFGYDGPCPSRIERHERCAVTLEQFEMWVSPSAKLRICNPYPEWHLVEYSVLDQGMNVGWRIDNDQVIFDPLYAQRMGPISVMRIYNPLDRSKVSV